MNDSCFYLASTEGYGLETPRRCVPLKRLRAEDRDDLMLVRLSPPLPGQAFGRGGNEILLVVLGARHARASLFPVSKWPLSVHVALPDVENAEDLDAASPGLESVAWAEIYRAAEDFVPTDSDALAAPEIAQRRRDQ